jgi:hypothetical protein
MKNIVAVAHRCDAPEPPERSQYTDGDMPETVRQHHRRDASDRAPRNLRDATPCMTHGRADPRDAADRAPCTVHHAPVTCAGCAV